MRHPASGALAHITLTPPDGQALQVVDPVATSQWGWVSLVARASDSQSDKVGSNPACALKQGTLSYLFHLWTEMLMVVLLAETDFISDFRC